MSPRAEGLERPQNYAQCMVCGAAWSFTDDGDPAGFRAWLREHDDCKMLGVAAARCRETDCINTGVGINQKCIPHGGKPVPRAKR